MGPKAPAPAGVQMKISGYDVHFPFKPYASQLGVMGKVLKAADSGENALLESPTGSGKSLALLCSALAWQERWKATHGVGGAGVKVDDEGWIEDADPCSAPASSAPASSSAGDKENVVSPDDVPAAAPAATRKPPKVPRIYYATRTHSQIAQVVKELKRTAYRPSMVVLGSREHYCINKSVRARKGRNLGEECKALLEGGARRAGRENADETGGGGGGGGCGYSHGALKLAGAAQRPGSSPVDIEDLVKLGGKTRGCPYFAAKHMSETAELIFCPYNYLLDPSVRAAMDVDVKGALVILDEAHNVEDTAREAASCDVKLSDVVAAAEEFRRVADDEIVDRDRDSNPSGNALLASVLEGVARWLGGASDLSHPRCPLRADGFERWMAVWSDGARVARQMRDMGLDPERLASMEDARKAAVKEANDSKTPPARRVGGAALKTAEMLFTSARYASGGGGFGGGGGGAHDFRLVVQRTLAESAAGGGFGDEDERSATTTLSLWALNPALAFGDLAGPGGARAVVLTSGTLAPLNSFASELGVPFPIRMEAPHCVDMNTQVWAGAVATGPGGAKLNGTFKTAAEFAYQDDLGAALASWCEDVPHGVLVFFPSYSMLDRVAKRWRTTGLWKRLEQNTGKRIFQEPRGNEPSRDANGPGGRGGGRGRGGGGGRGRGGASAGGRENALDALLSKYYRAVKSSVAAAPHPHAAAPPGSASRGAVLLAVCRGKVSEGIDFADANARAVVIVGIPYPNVKDKQVELKRQYNNEGARRGLLSGDQWYSQQAFRALNQAVGRCLRHRSDHGAILLADDRYAHGAGGDLCRHLPKWLRPATRKCASFEDSKRGVRAFFDARAADPPPTRVEPETLALPPSVRDASKSKQGRDAAAANASNRTRKPREKERAAAEEGDEESNARGKQRDIKNFFAPVGAATGAGGGTDAGATDNGSSFGHGLGLGLGHGSFAVPSGPHPHQLPLVIAEERETRRGWTSAPPPPPLESDPRVTSQLTDPPTAPPTQDARTTSTLTDPNDTAAVTETETTVTATATTAVERVMERMEREFERRRGTATESAAPVETEPMPPPPPIMGRAGDTSGTPRGGPSPRAATQPTPGSARGGGWGGVEEDATGWGGTPATQATPGAGWAGWGATQQFRDPVPERAPAVAPTPTPPRRAPPPEPAKTAEDVDGEEALDASGGTQPEEPEEPEEPDEPEPARVCEPARCRSCGAEVAPSLASLERRAAGDLTYLATLAEANGDARVPDVDRVALVVPALVAARRLCAAPAPIRPRTDAGDVPPPNWAGDCQGVWVPEDGCYYAPLRCRGRWVGVRVEATDHARRDLAGCTLLLEASLREGEPTPRVEPSKTRKRTVVDDDDEGREAPEREENERADDDPDAADAAAAAAADPPAEEPARKRRRIRRKASAEAAVGRRRDDGALPRRAARAKPRLPDPDEVVGRSMVKNFGRHGDFVGIVESWDPKRGYYRIVYGDGDEEELEPRELQWFLK